MMPEINKIDDIQKAGKITSSIECVPNGPSSGYEKANELIQLAITAL